MTRRLAITAAVLLAACQGERGPAGVDGDVGPSGPSGPSGPTGPAGPGFVALEPSGVVGVVADASGAAVTGGKVVFVKASDVAALPTLTATTAAASTDDEPLEDLVRANPSYAQAPVGTDGVYRLATLEPGAYFLTFVPADGAAVLPGGSACRTARSSDGLVGTRLDIEVSAAIPADAEYVGSSKCIACHGRSHISGTMHRLGIWSPASSGPLQDLEARRGDLYQAIDTKFASGQEVFFHGYDAARGMDRYRTSEADPGSGVSFKVKVRREADGRLFMDLVNVKSPGVGDASYEVHAIYGGGVMKQRYLTKIVQPNDVGNPDDDTFYYALLPLQFQNEGSEGYADRTAKVWRDYNAWKWYDDAAGTFKVPGPKDSFEKNCVSCHAAGVRITGTDATTWKAHTVEDAQNGDFDYDGNGVAEEMNVGCESCHGPGSRHWEAAGQGKHIVSLKLLTPEREAMVCGQCHSRPKGAFNTDSPVDADGWMMIAGTSRADYLANNALSQLDGATSDFWADAGKHSKSHHQQYTDFIRSRMYKNDVKLMTCSSCHDPHRKTAQPRQLRASPADNAALCGSCHATQGADVLAHLVAKGIPSAATKAASVLCTDCHMPKTAKTGAGQPSVLGASVTTHWMYDVSSHKFDVPRKADVTASAASGTKMPAPISNACGSCHAGTVSGL